MIESPAIREFVLSFADDEHLIGQQHTEWIGVAPFLEEDLAFASIGQDELGHAALLYALVAGDDDFAIDELAYRSATEYRSCHLVEYATTDWAEALVRHWMYDNFEQLRWDLVAESSVRELADISVRAGREEAYHLRHADALLDVLLANPDSSTRILTARDAITPLALGMFEPVVGEADAIADGVASASIADLLPTWVEHATDRFGSPLPSVDAEAQTAQSARTERSADFAPLMTRMREVLDFDPNAVW